MSPEWLTAIGTIGTFVVIAASAIAALAQIKHLRASNQIAALNEVRERVESAEFQDFVQRARQLPALLRDPAVRRKLVAAEDDFAPELQWVLLMIYFYEQLGTLVKHRVIDKDVACETWALPLLMYWPNLAPVVANRRAALRMPALWQNFEYLISVSKQWLAKHPQGSYPSDAPRVPMPELWPETIENVDVT